MEIDKEILKKYKNILTENGEISADWIENEYFQKYHDPIVEKKDKNALKDLDIFLDEYKDLLEATNSYYEFKYNTYMRYLPFPDSEQSINKEYNYNEIKDFFSIFYNKIYKYKKQYKSPRAIFLYFYYHLIQNRDYYNKLSKDFNNELNEVLSYIKNNNDFYSDLLVVIEKIRTVLFSSISEKTKKMILEPIKKSIINTNHKWNSKANLSDIQ